MQPLQVWLPLLGGSIKRPKVGGDAARAFKEWRDELVVWTMPKLQRPRRWRSDGVGHLAVPAEEFERIDIVHVTEDGRIYAPTIKGRTPGTVDGLLYEWLNLYKNGGLSLVPAADSITVKAPRLDGPNEVSWTERTISIGPGTYLPISSVNRRRRTVSMVWPPEGAPAPISPESESAVRFPSKKVSSDPPTVVTAQGDRAPHLFLRWPGRLQPLMPPLSGVDDIQAQIDMAMLARRSRPELAEILRAATSSAHPYLFDGHSIFEHSWFRPTLEHKGIKHVLLKAEDRGLAVSGRSLDENALNEALKQEAWQKWLAQPVPIRRAGAALASSGRCCSRGCKRIAHLECVSSVDESSPAKRPSDSAAKAMTPNALEAAAPLTNAVLVIAARMLNGFPASCRRLSNRFPSSGRSNSLIARI